MLPTKTSLERLRAWEKAGLLAFLLIVVGFGFVVEIRSCYLKTRKTDLGCYLRAGWAMRVGQDIYTVQDDNYWHYAYPPVFALAMVPLADAPKGEPREWMLPYPVTVALWYVFSVVCIFLAVHWIAGALESRSPIPRGCRLWWYHRMIPVYICIAPIGCTLSRGQVNLILVMFIAGMFANMVRGHGFRSGLWLSAAICLKVIPAFLLIVPVWRRDGRALLGVATGLLVGIVLLPSALLGFDSAVHVHERMVEAILLPGLAEGQDRTRARELMELNATDNQSIQATLHNYLHWQQARLHRPGQASLETKIAHVSIGVLLTLGLILGSGWRRTDDPVDILLFIGGLAVVMAVISPVSHTHYFCLAVPVVMALGHRSSVRQGDSTFPAASTSIFLALVALLFALPMIPFWEVRREAGLPLAGCLILWAATMKALLSRRQASVAEQPAACELRAAA